MLNIPDYYTQVNSLPDDPENSIPYCVRSEHADVIVMMAPIQRNNAMPYDEPRQIIEVLHNTMSPVQGIIEVNADKTENGNRYVYTLIKTLRKPSGVNYLLTLDMEFPDSTVRVRGQFDESGTTGIRDNTVLQYMIRQGIVEPDLTGWNHDPYDPDFTKGICMNLSEDQQFDQYFPDHPLSIARELIEYIKSHN